MSLQALRRSRVLPLFRFTLIAFLLSCAPAGASTLSDSIAGGTRFTRATEYVQVVTLAVEYVQSVELADFLASLPTPPPVTATEHGVKSPFTGGEGGGGSLSASQGDCYAGPIPAYIVTRESGGDPGAVNASSGARGCFQIMGFVHDANCSDLGWSVPDQIECANRISDGGRNLQPWSTG